MARNALEASVLGGILTLGAVRLVADFSLFGSISIIGWTGQAARLCFGRSA